MDAKADVLSSLGNEDRNISQNSTVAQLISSLRSNFLPRQFSLVEEILVRREEKLRRENEILKEKHEIEGSEKARLQKELKNFEKECSRLNQTNTRLLEENKIICAREKNAEERCKNALEMVEKVGEVDKGEILKLRKKSLELEMEKRKLEETVELYKRRFEDLNLKVLNVEEVCSNLMPLFKASKNVVGLGSVGTKEKMDGENGANGENSVDENNSVNENEAVLDNIVMENGKDLSNKLVCENNVTGNQDKARGNEGSFGDGSDENLCNEKKENLEVGIGSTGSSQGAGTQKYAEANIIEISDGDEENDPENFITTAENMSGILKRKRDSSPNLDPHDNDIEDKKPRNSIPSSINNVQNFFSPGAHASDASRRRSIAIEDLRETDQRCFEYLQGRDGPESSSSSDSSSDSDEEIDLGIFTNDPIITPKKY